MHDIDSSADSTPCHLDTRETFPLQECHRWHLSISPTGDIGPEQTSSSDSRVQSKNQNVRTRQSCRRCMQQTSSLGISYLNIPPFGLAPSSGPAAITAPHSPLTKRPRPRTAKLQSSDRESCETLCPSRFGRGCSTGNYPTCFTIPMDFFFERIPTLCIHTAFRHISRVASHNHGHEP